LTHIEWWKNSKLIRERKQQVIFLLITIVVTPFGLSTDLIIPALNNVEVTIPPLICVVMLMSASHLFISLRKNNTLSITSNNVSRYIFKSVNIPIIVLDNNNVIKLVNSRARSFIGNDSIGKNADRFILINDRKPRQTFFNDAFDRRSVMIKTKSGLKDCEMLLSIENDKYDEALCKVITLMDMTDVYYDALTGVYNRRFLNENLSRVVSSLARNNSFLSFMMIDIDCFKNYNDHYSHLEGDKCLRIIAQALYNSVRRGEDFIVRYGGEEFAIVLPNTDEIGARSFAETILEVVRDLNIPHANSCVTDIVTVSIGVSVGIPSISDNILFVQKADDMLYQSKQNGRNRYSLINLDNEIDNI
jgi:diguanylate cyclase (GGDEF)-like protein